MSITDCQDQKRKLLEAAQKIIEERDSDDVEQALRDAFDDNHELKDLITEIMDKDPKILDLIKGNLKEAIGNLISPKDENEDPLDFDPEGELPDIIREKIDLKEEVEKPENLALIQEKVTSYIKDDLEIEKGEDLANKIEEEIGESDAIAKALKSDDAQSQIDIEVCRYLTDSFQIESGTDLAEKIDKQVKDSELLKEGINSETVQSTINQKISDYIEEQDLTNAEETKIRRSLKLEEKTEEILKVPEIQELLENQLKSAVEEIIYSLKSDSDEVQKEVIDALGLSERIPKIIGEYDTSNKLDKIIRDWILKSTPEILNCSRCKEAMIMLLISHIEKAEIRLS